MMTVVDVDALAEELWRARVSGLIVEAVGCNNSIVMRQHRRSTRGQGHRGGPVA